MLLPRRYEEAFGTRSGWRIDWALLGRMLYYGLPSGVVVAIDVLSWALFIVFIGRMGELELTVTTIAFTLNLFAYLPAMGLGQAVGILVGQNQGKGDPDTSARITWRGLYYAMGINGTVAVFFLIMPQTLAWMFQDPATTPNWEQVSVLVALTLRFVVLYVLFDTMNLVFSHALRGAGDTLFVSVLGLVLAWPVLVIPTWAAYRYQFGMFFAWGAATVFVILLALAFLLRFLSGKWRSMRVIEETLPFDVGSTTDLGWPPAAEVVLAEQADGVVSSDRDRISEEPTEASKT
jgi:MATE family multidrug resistance protein